MKKNLMIGAFVIGLLGSSFAFANDLFNGQLAEQEQAIAPVPRGEDTSFRSTQEWLSLQREGTHASPNKQELSGPVLTNIHQRYVDGFKHPIPDKFERQKMTDGN
ncbi:Protein of unknown function [Methylobacillus rhizosphaerae]|uniref:DUF3613 domain-containing protein n=1 Tax=Methylobacillus rhizosphaerae TaxID=551994 RepID=A0A238YJW1_9PROT|nr:DUF3613 domain-containing protein [Methylobacillus rhizosphaerae]SNR71546.1 Protein of unknown function [Methylobacillus rhizosphaerae]